VFAFAQTSASPPPASSDADAAITKLREGLIDSFFKGDIDRTLTFLAPDVIITWQNGEVSRGPDEVRAYYNRMMTGPNRIVQEIKAEPKVEGRQVHGDWAISWGSLNDHFVLTDGRSLSLGSRFTITTAKRGDRWLLTSYHASVNAFDNAVLTMAVKKTGLWVGIGGAVLGLLIGYVVARARRHPTGGP
jgi:ketosteroid isomerase-like protein